MTAVVAAGVDVTVLGCGTDTLCVEDAVAGVSVLAGSLIGISAVDMGERGSLSVLSDMTAVWHNFPEKPSGHTQASSLVLSSRKHVAPFLHGLKVSHGLDIVVDDMAGGMVVSDMSSLEDE